MSDLDRVDFGGKTVDRRTAAMLAEAQRLANAEDPGIGKFSLTQGSWSHASASAGTHDGPGAFDMYTQGFTDEQKDVIGLALRRVGFASWRRLPSQGPWGEHWHGIAIGTEGLAPLASSQVQSYRDGRTGLRGNRVDDQPRPDHLLTWEQYQQEQPASSTPAEEPEPETVAAAADPWAMPAGQPLTVDPDTDDDGLSDAFEKLAGTRRKDADSDDDGLADGYEAAVSHTDPLAKDTDADGVLDAAEVATGTDAGRQPGVGGVVGTGVFAEKVGPKTPDRDADGLSDRFEKRAGTNRRSADTDDDQVPDSVEVAMGTDPTVADSDQDGLSDGFERSTGSDALSSFTDAEGRTVKTAAWTPERAYALRTGKEPDPARPGLWAIPAGEQLGGTRVLPGAGKRDPDTDHDGLTDAFEALVGSDTHRADTDRDGLSDGVEAVRWHTDPLRVDTDGDRLGDGDEVGAGSDAGRVRGVGGVVGTGAAAENAAGAKDRDADGLSDRTEKLIGSASTKADSDADHLPDATEVALGTNPTLADTDADGISDSIEVRFQSDPLAAGSTLGAGLTPGLGGGAPEDPLTDPAAPLPDLDPDPT